MSLQCDNLSGELQDQWSSSFLIFYILDKVGARQELDEMVSCLNCFLVFYRLDKAGARQELDEMVSCIKKFFFQPEKFGLKPRTES